MNVRVLDGSHDPGLGGFLSLYEQSFPPEERDSVEVIRSQIDSPRSDRPFWNLVAEANGDLLGITRCGYLPATGAGFLVHIAVSPKVRGRGVGEALLRDAARRCEDVAKSMGAPYNGMLLEIERQDDAQGPEDLMTRIARIRWFTQRGVRLLTPDYTQPSLGPGLPPVSLGLYILGPENADVRSLIKDFYAEAFDLEPEHPYVRRALSGARP